MTTVQAIFEGTIQVLLRDGFRRLTTTRVAERAGVSVGTIYQYFPDKRAILAALLKQHVDAIVEAVETTCSSQHSRAVSEMMEVVCNVFVDSKVLNRETSLALYGVADDVGGEELVRAAGLRTEVALIDMLATAADASFSNLKVPAMIIINATIGPVKAVMEAGADPEAVKELRRHLVDLCTGYLERLKSR